MHPSLMTLLQLALLLYLPFQELTALTAPGTCPNGRRIRKEIRDLTAEEAHDFVKGMRTIYSNGVTQPMVDMHIRTLEFSHNCPQFLPYHRFMTWNLENKLLEVTSKLKGLPYWDSTYDVDEPLAAFPFRDDIMGTATPAGDTCLEGPFSGLQFSNKCVTRSLSGKSVWQAPELLAQSVMYFDRYILFNNYLQAGQHYQLHDFFKGSNFGRMSISPSDPLFWLHHGAIDYYWTKWQGMNNNANYFKYDGQYSEGVRKAQYVSPNDIIEGFNVSSLLDYYNSLCYYYEIPKNAPLKAIPFDFNTMESTTPDGFPAQQSTQSSNNPANLKKSVSAPTEVKSIRLPTGLSSEFIDEWGLNKTQVSDYQELLKHFVTLLNDRRANGASLPTLADLNANMISKPPTKGPSSGAESISFPSVYITAIVTTILFF